MREVLAVPVRPGRLEDVAHVVILVREGRRGARESAGAAFRRALASVFTVCEAYYEPVAGADEDRSERPGQGALGGWAAYAERLAKAGVGLRTYRSSSVRDFVADAAAGRLPQVSWVVVSAEPGGAAARDEAAAVPVSPVTLGTPVTQVSPVTQDMPVEGVGREVALEQAVLAALVARPEVWARSVLFLTGDEYGDEYGHGGGRDGYDACDTFGEGGLFGDRAAPPVPVPPLADGRGKSTVSTDGETRESGPFPVGLGSRVPLIVASPWTRGGVVDSAVLDHTSVIRFLERRFGVREPGISAWRREVSGDLLSVFDFAGEFGEYGECGGVGGGGEFAGLSGGEADPARSGVPAPLAALLPRQTAAARPLPYALSLQSRLREGKLELSLRNDGSQGAVVQVRPEPGARPYHYTVGARATLTDALPLGPQGFDLWARGPAGARWQLRGRDSMLEASLQMVERADPEGPFTPGEAERELRVRLANRGRRARTFVVGDPAYGGGVREVRVAAHTTRVVLLPVPEHGWYDVAVTVADEPYFLRRSAGRVPGGGLGVTDPARGLPQVLRVTAGLGSVLGADLEGDGGAEQGPTSVMPGRPVRLEASLSAIDPIALLGCGVVAPDGWRVRELAGPGEALGARTTTTLAWEVTAPDAAAGAGPYRLRVLCVGSAGERLVLGEAAVTVRVGAG
ncbi:alkaline phosphatase family protein [Streptomyces sp. NA04227]|uniref:alkaline phosphatase family protein n=1 Tax=Streptomyces sp. NA04227 TaxID=2742136 RepID=UPI001C379542|nr:alkaline phosphatase family protein [Streptomyces sp. NA04227]